MVFKSLAGKELIILEECPHLVQGVERVSNLLAVFLGDSWRCRAFHICVLYSHVQGPFSSCLLAYSPLPLRYEQ